MSLQALIEAVEIGNEAAAKLNARKLVPDYAPDIGRAYNGSLDAAKRLHDALLPGWHVSELQEAADPSDYPGQHWLVVIATREEAKHAVEATAACPARAWLLSILRARTEQGQNVTV